MLTRIRKPQHASNNLFHIHARGTVRQRRQNVGKGAVPALFQRVHGDDIANGTIRRQQIDAFQFVNFRGLNGNLLLRNANLNQFGFQLFKGCRILFTLGLCLKQNNRTDVCAVLILFGF